MKDKAFDLVNVSKNDFKEWCKNNSKDSSSQESKRLFFKLILEQKIVKNTQTNKLEVLK